jgi:hypothetical protein
MYINHATSIKDEIEKYIRQRYGLRSLDRARKYFNGHVTIDAIKKDDTFSEGAFYVWNNDYSYDLWVKNTEYSKGWWSGKVSYPTVQKIREYRIIEEEQYII